MSQARLAKEMSEFGFKMVQSTIAKMERDEDRRPVRLGEAVMLSFILGEDLQAMLYGPLGDDSVKVDALRDQLAEMEGELESLIERYDSVRSEYEDKLQRRVHLLREQIEGLRLLDPRERQQKEALLQEALGELRKPEHDAIAHFIVRDDKVTYEE